jgi:hypothetical protein
MLPKLIKINHNLVLLLEGNYSVEIKEQRQELAHLQGITVSLVLAR